MKSTVINIRTFASRMVCSMATCRSLLTLPIVANVARVNARCTRTLALAPARPRGVSILTARLSNDTDLKWEANKEPDIAGYEIVWRDTTSPVWTNSKPVGNVTTFTMKGMSKDNYFFGVRAVIRTAIEVWLFIQNRSDAQPRQLTRHGIRRVRESLDIETEGSFSNHRAGSGV
jgi:hypothetical protein